MLRRRLAVLVVLTVICVGTVVAVAAGRETAGREAAGRETAPAKAPATAGIQARVPPNETPATTNQVPASPSDAIGALLDRRAQALLAGDLDGWLAPLAPTGRFTSAQRTLFARIRTAKPVEWRYQVAGGTALPEVRRRELGGTAWLADVQLAYRLTAGGALVHRQQYLTMVRATGGWRIAADSDGATARDLWDLAALVRVDAARCVVLGVASRSSQVRQLAGECGRSAARVDDVWGRSWPRRTVLTVPGSLRQLAVLLGRDGGATPDTSGLDDTAAVTIGPSDGAADGVLINGPALDLLSDLGRRVVLTHELVHVATRATGARYAPTWLSEGFADHVAYEGTGLPPSQIAGAALTAVRAGHEPSKLPTEADFDAATSGAEAAYDESWVAVGLIAERAGGDSHLRTFYDRAASKPDDQRGLNQALAAIGLDDVNTFTGLWQARLRRLAK